MIANRLSLSNYRGFTQVELEFDSAITVLAGVNGSGKSGILRALAALLSHLLRDTGPSKDAAETVGSEDVHLGKSALTLSATFSDGVRTHHAQITKSIPDPSKAKEYAKRRDEARFAIRETRKGSKKHTELLEKIRFLEGLLDDAEPLFTHQVEGPKRAASKNSKAHPIAILYATTRYLDRIAPTLSRVRAFEPAIACKDALSGAEVSLTAFANWFRAAQQGALGSKAHSNRMLGSLNRVVEALLPGFTEPRVTDEARARVMVKKNGTEFDVRQLSDGERGLLALAFDLTRRLAIANPGLKDPVSEGAAIVLLDEIELHLHPSWQRKVLGMLMETFKSCQFIATTHSPQVLGELDASKIWVLGSGKPYQPLRAFGMDSSRILEEIMDAAPRNKRIGEKIRKLSVAVDKNDKSTASKLLSQLRRQLGDNSSEVLEAETMLRFLEGK